MFVETGIDLLKGIVISQRWQPIAQVLSKIWLEFEGFTIFFYLIANKSKGDFHSY